MEDFLSINMPNKQKSSFDDVDSSMLASNGLFYSKKARNMNLNMPKMHPDMMNNQMDSLKDQEEFNDHFIDQPYHEKVSFEQNLQNDIQQTPPVPESKLHSFNNNSFMIMHKKQLLQREFNQNQRTLNESQRQMKNVMSEPKFYNPGFPMSNSNPNLHNAMGIVLKNEAGLNNSIGNNDNLEGQGSESNNMRKQKGNVKNTYIKKINSLINLSRIEDTHVKAERAPIIVNNKKEEIKDEKEKNSKASKDSQFKRSISFNSNLSSNNPTSNIKKLERNRESARNSRQRKKMYIELLENKVHQLTAEIDETKQVLEQNNENFNSICHNSKYLNSLVVGRQQLFEKLEKSFSQDKPDEYQISLLIDSFRLRLGASGRERVKSIDYFFDQIVENFLPSSLKYLLLSASQQDGILDTKTDFPANMNDFNNVQPKQNANSSKENLKINNIKSLLGGMNLNSEQQAAMNRMIKKLAMEKKKFDGFLKCLNEIKKNLHKHCSNIENIVDEISYSLNPIQIGKFLLTLEKERNRKEFSVEKLWFGYQIEQDDEKEDGNSTPYSSTYSVSAHNDNIKRASNYNEIPGFNNDEDYPENDSFYMDQVQKKIHINNKN